MFFLFVFADVFSFEKHNCNYWIQFCPDFNNVLSQASNTLAANITFLYK